MELLPPEFTDRSASPKPFIGLDSRIDVLRKIFEYDKEETLEQLVAARVNELLAEEDDPD